MSAPLFGLVVIISPAYFDQIHLGLFHSGFGVSSQPRLITPSNRFMRMLESVKEARWRGAETISSSTVVKPKWILFLGHN